MKKANSIITAAVAAMLVFVFALSAGAEQTQELKLVCADTNVVYISEAQATGYKTYDFDSIRDYLEEQFRLLNTEISLEQYAIPYTQETFAELYDYIRNEMPEMFHLNNGLNLKISGLTNTMKTLVVTYGCSKAQFESIYAQMMTNADYLLRGLDTSSLTDVEKALILHDRLAVWAEYGKGGTKTAPVSEAYASMVGPLVNQIGVCSGYSKAYKYLLSKVGISSYMVTSVALDHTWNIVKIGGKLYHVDVTWDDTTPDTFGSVDHGNFLRSTKGIKANGHDTNDFDSSPVSTTYDNGYWNRSQTAFQYVNGAIYYIDNLSGVLKKRVGSSESNVLTISGNWNGYYTLCNSQKMSCYARLSSDNSYVYYSNGTKIIRVNPANGSTADAYAPSLSGNRRIFGFKAEKGTFYLQTRTVPDGESNVIKTSFAVNYTVNYDANGGTGAPAAQTVKEGAAANYSTVKPTRAGYIFLGWSTQKGAQTAAIQPGDAFTASKNITLYAVWKADGYVITYNANGGSGAPAAQSVKEGAAVNYSTVKPSRTGYTFLGWSAQKDAKAAEIQPGDAFTAAKSITLYAVWKANTYTLTFNANGGVCTQSPVTVTYDKPIGVCPAAVREGYIFSGWYVDGALINADTVCKFTSNKIAAAKWSSGYSVNIRNYVSERTVDYKSTVIFTADAVPAGSGAEICWYDADGRLLLSGSDTYTASRATSSFTVQARLVSAGKTIAQSPVEKVNVNAGFLNILIAFFRSLFGSLPVIYQ